MNDEVSGLVERAVVTLEAARTLAQTGFYNDCISRAYCAAFYAAEAALLDMDLSASTHKGVHMMFGKHLVKPGALPPALGKDLSRLFEKRRTSDYEGNMTRTEEDADEALQKAGTFVEAVRRHLREQP